MTSVVELAGSRAPLDIRWANIAAHVRAAVGAAARNSLQLPARPILLRLLAAIGTLGRGAEPVAPPDRLKIAVVQMALAPTLAGNRDRIVGGIGDAAARGARVAVFPERALSGDGGNDTSAVDAAVEVIRRATRERGIYAVFGGNTWSTALKKSANWMRVFGPDGADLLYYDKIYENHRARMPGVFAIDGIPCSAMICADRWLRGIEEIPIQQGAQISFELSNNFASEWVAPFGWYWYVPRALRNNVWVVFANTGNTVSGVIDPSPAITMLRHGRSAVIAPDGRVTAALTDDVATTLFAEIDPGKATRHEALARSRHPALRRFWEAGLAAHRGETSAASPVKPMTAPETRITLAVAQAAGSLAVMEPAIREAAARKADLVAFPARAIDEAELPRLQAAARRHQIAVVFGAEHRAGGGKWNSAFVIGPDGLLLTRYDQLSAAGAYQPGTDAAAMWFRVKGVPAIVTVGRDALWTELAELAAVAGARVVVHLDHDAADDAGARLRRVQIGSNFASFLTFTAAANVVEGMLWDDVQTEAERRIAVKQEPVPNPDGVEVLSPFSANLVARTSAHSPLVVATRTVPAGANPYHPRRTSRINPQMEPWYRVGVECLGPK